MGVEGYASEWHGFFPRFLLAAAASTSLDWLLPQVLELALVRAGYNYQTAAQTIFPLAFLSFPFAFFLLFYFCSRVRIDLGRTYLRVAASIFLGCLAGETPMYILQFSLSGSLLGPSPGLLGIFLYMTGSAVGSSLNAGFIAFRPMSVLDPIGTSSPSAVEVDFRPVY